MTAKLFREAQRVLKEIVHKYGIAVLAAQIIATFVFPFIEVVLALVKTTWYIWLIIGVIHIILGVFATAGTAKWNEFIKLANIDQIEQEIKKTETELNEERGKVKLLYDEFDEHFHRQIAIQASLHILNKIMQDEKPGASLEDVEKLLTPLIKDRSEALGYKNKELYNIAVYIYDPNDKKLKIFFRACDNRIQRNDREWEVGVGHVGVAFAQSETIIKSNAQNDNEYSGKHSRETDNQYYASYVSSPIFNGGENKSNEIGVFVITSSRPNHFEDDDKIIVESYSFLLSLYFSGCKANEPKTA